MQRHRSWWRICLPLVIAGCGISENPDPSCFRIFGAAAQPDAVLPRDTQAAVGVIGLSNDPENPFVRGCSGTLIAPGVLLTAAHCVFPYEEDLRVSISFLSPSTTATETSCGYVEAERSVIHDAYDVALYFFDPEAVDASPLPYTTDVPPIGTPVVLAGFGLDESREFGTRRVAETFVVEHNEEQIVVEHPEAIGACVGDSGGPALWLRDGTWYVTGSLSAGDSSCIGQDMYVSTASIDAWIEATLGSQ